MRRNALNALVFDCRELPTAVLALGPRLIFFLDCLSSYIQMDVIDSSYSPFLAIFEKMDVSSFSLDDFKQKHQSALDNILDGCFLNKSPTSATIMDSITEIMMCADTFVKEVSNIVNDRNQFQKLRFQPVSEVHCLNHRPWSCSYICYTRLCPALKEPVASL